MSRLIEKLTNTSRTSSDGDITAQTSTSSLEQEVGSSPSSSNNKHSHLPWMASTPHRAGPPPRQLLWYRQDALFEAAMEGNLSKMQACFPQSQPMSNIHSVRTVTGLTVLHCAVWSGHLPAVRYLLEEQNLYMDITDWQGGTPLSTLLTKPGKDRIYELHPEKRQAMMDYLLQQGANPYFPWKEEEDLAQEQVCTACCGQKEWLEKARQASPYRALFQQCQSRMMLHTPEDKSRQREQTSKPSLLKSEQDQQLEHYLQLQWKARTATWLVCYNRAETMRFFQPVGKNVSCSYTSLDQIETLWRECQQAHQAWRTSYTAPKILGEPQSKPQAAQSKTIHTLLPNAPPMPAMVATGGGGVSAALEEQEQERLKSKFYKPLPENLSERYKAVLMQRPRLPQDVILRNLVINTTSSPEKKSPQSPPNLSSPSEGDYNPAKDDAKQHLQKALSHLDQSSTSLIQCLISNSNHEFSKFRTQAEATSMATHMV